MNGIDEFTNRLDGLPCLSDEEIADRRDTERKRTHRQICEMRWDRLKRDIGPRYQHVGLDNFEAESDDQTKIHDRLTRIAARIDEFINSRCQLFIWGSVGTGKDHLAISVLKYAAQMGFDVRWKQGTELYDRIACSRENGETHTSIYEQLTNPDVLCLSDPVFNRNWSPAKADALSKIVRRRYDRGKTTWVTVNSMSTSQASEMMYPDVYDRLKDRAIFIECKWKSHRRKYD